MTTIKMCFVVKTTRTTSARAGKGYEGDGIRVDCLTVSLQGILSLYTRLSLLEKGISSGYMVTRFLINVGSFVSVSYALRLIVRSMRKEIILERS